MGEGEPIRRTKKKKRLRLIALLAAICVLAGGCTSAKWQLKGMPVLVKMRATIFLAKLNLPLNLHRMILRTPMHLCLGLYQSPQLQLLRA